MLKAASRSLSMTNRAALLAAKPENAWLKELGIHPETDGVFDGKWHAGKGEQFTPLSPFTGEPIAHVRSATAEQYDAAVNAAVAAQKEWRNVSMPARGDVVNEIGRELVANLDLLSKLESLEVGKTYVESKGEILEYIHICEYATSMSRQAHGAKIPSERANHQLEEIWNPLGVCAVITAFNFPIAVYGWNAAIAMYTGNTMIWKPPPTSTLTSIAVQNICAKVLERNGYNPAVCSFVTGGADIGKAIASDKRVPLVSFTGSTAVGREVGVEVQRRFGKSILELGGNNALIVAPDYTDTDSVIKSVVFAAFGTQGQRCTTLRRLMLPGTIYDEILERMKNGAAKLLTKIGDPLDAQTLYGPMHNQAGVDLYLRTIEKVKEAGGTIECGGKVMDRPGFFVEPTIVTGLPHDHELVQEEAFCPIVYLLKYDNLEQAMEWNNEVDQGLSSAIFTNDIKTQYWFTGPNGSDCGIANINAPTNGAEIGGAFGGNKSTGWGREAGSDSWKQYMRRATSCVNYSGKVVLAQGIEFDV